MIKAGTSPNTIPAMKPTERPVEPKGDDQIHPNSASLANRMLGSKMAAPLDFSPPAGQFTMKDERDWLPTESDNDHFSHLSQQDKLNNKSGNTPSTQSAIEPWRESNNGVPKNRQTATEILNMVKICENGKLELSISESLEVTLVPRGSGLPDPPGETLSFTRTSETPNLSLSDALCNALRRDFKPCWRNGSLKIKFAETLGKIRNFIDKEKSGNIPGADDITNTITNNLKALEKRLADEHDIDTKGNLEQLEAAFANDNQVLFELSLIGLVFATDTLDARCALLAHASTNANGASNDQNTKLSELTDARDKLKQAIKSAKDRWQMKNCCPREPETPDPEANFPPTEAQADSLPAYESTPSPTRSERFLKVEASPLALLSVELHGPRKAKLIETGTSPYTIPAMNPTECPIEPKGDDLIHRNRASLAGHMPGRKMAAPQDLSPPAGQSTEKEDDDWEYIDLKADNSSYLMQQDELNNNFGNTPSTQPAIQPWLESHSGVQENRQTVIEILDMMKICENGGRLLNIRESLKVTLAPRRSRLLDGLRRTFSFTRTLETRNRRLSDALYNALRREFEHCWREGDFKKKFTKTFDSIRNFIGKEKNANVPSADDIAKTIAENLKALEKRLADEHNIDTKDLLEKLVEAACTTSRQAQAQARLNIMNALDILNARRTLLTKASAYANDASNDLSAKLNKLDDERTRLTAGIASAEFVLDEEHKLVREPQTPHPKANFSPKNRSTAMSELKAIPSPGYAPRPDSGLHTMRATPDPEA